MIRDAETLAMVEQLVGRANAAMVACLNKGAELIYERSQKEVPKSEAHSARPRDASYPAEPLAARARVIGATPGTLTANVEYPGPYAAAQEAGRMTYHSRGGKEVEWEATHYTVPGTKAHYLEDAGKSVIGELPEELAIQGHIAMGDLPGFIASRQQMQTLGRRAEAKPGVTGIEGQIMAREQSVADITPPESLREVPGGHPPTLQ